MYKPELILAFEEGLLEEAYSIFYNVNLNQPIKLVGEPVGFMATDQAYLVRKS